MSRTQRTAWPAIPFFPGGILHFLRNTGLHAGKRVIFFSRINLQRNTVPCLSWNRSSGLLPELQDCRVSLPTASATVLPPIYLMEMGGKTNVCICKDCGAKEQCFILSKASVSEVLLSYPFTGFLWIAVAFIVKIIYNHEWEQRIIPL